MSGQNATVEVQRLEHEAAVIEEHLKTKTIELHQIQERIEKIKSRKRTCRVPGCLNRYQQGGLCIKHGAKVKICTFEGCTNHAKVRGVCVRHGADITKWKKYCSFEGCSNVSVRKGVCVKHGAKVKRKFCSAEGCTNQLVSGGVCKRHGATKKQCSNEGCVKQALKGGLCWKHGAKDLMSAKKNKICSNNATGIKGVVDAEDVPEFQLASNAADNGGNSC